MDARVSSSTRTAAGRASAYVTRHNDNNERDARNSPLDHREQNMYILSGIFRLNYLTS